MLVARPENVACRLVPSAVAPEIITTEISDAIRPYSIAVAPDSFLTKRAKSFMLVLLKIHVLCNTLFCDWVYPNLTRENLSKNNLKLVKTQGKFCINVFYPQEW